MYFNCHSHYSFQYGTLSIKDLFEEARANRVSKLILTDINNTSGYIDLLRTCIENRNEWDLQIALGIEFRVDNELLYIGLAKNEEGFRELNAFLAFRNINKQPLPRRAPYFKDVYLIYPTSNVPDYLEPYEFIGIKHKELSKVFRKKLVTPKGDIPLDFVILQKV